MSLHPIVLKCRDLDEAWHSAIREIFNYGYSYTISHGSFAGQTRLEYDYVTIEIEHPNTRPLVTTVPQGIPAPTTMEYVESYLSYLMTSERKPNEEYTYGQFLEPQIAKVISMYKQHGYETNQAYMAVGDKFSIELTDPPCLRGIDTRIRYGKLHFMVYFRSWDLFAGFPSNLAAIQLLKEYMADEIGVEDGEIIAASKGLHIYGHFIDLAKAVIGKE